MPQLNLNIIESDAEIRNLILQALSAEVNKAIDKSLKSITNEIKGLIGSSLRSQPEYDSLKNGQLRYEFGIPNPENVDTIIDSIVNNSKFTKVPIKITNLGLSGGFTYIILDDSTIDGILYTDLASVVDSRGYNLPWLEWLLYSGVRPIVKDYKVQMGPNARSRTGMAIMVQSNKDWAVPPQFAGTISNNWFTRAMDNIDDDIMRIIKTAIENSI